MVAAAPEATALRAEAPGAFDESMGMAAPLPRGAERPAGFADSCQTLARDAEAWYDLEDVVDRDERELMSWLVRFQVADACEHWSKDALADRSCFAGATDASEEHDCVYRSGFDLFPRGENDLDPLYTALGAIRADPSEITCARVAEAWYSNVHWWATEYAMLVGHLPPPRDLADEQAYEPNQPPSYSARDRAALIAQSRADFARACEDERWSPAVRACIRVAPRGAAEKRCLQAVDGSIARVHRWTAPPLDRVTIHDAACDAYLAAVRGLLDCAPTDEVEQAFVDAASFAGYYARTTPPPRPDAELAARCVTRTRKVEAIGGRCRRLP